MMNSWVQKAPSQILRAKNHNITLRTIIFGTRQWLVNFDGSHGINITSKNVSFNNSMKLLSVTFNAALSFGSVQAHTHHTIPYCLGS